MSGATAKEINKIIEIIEPHDPICMRLKEVLRICKGLSGYYEISRSDF